MHDLNEKHEPLQLMKINLLMTVRLSHYYMVSNVTGLFLRVSVFGGVVKFSMNFIILFLWVF
jgi:hypothetical protein